MIHVFTPVVWKIYVPPRIHIFLWLLANNITFTRDNLALAKRREVLDKTCVFCSENESVAHLLFGCIAQCFWSVISEIIGFSIVSDFESMAKWWLREERYNDVNVLGVAVLWTIWKTRNGMYFQGVQWSKMEKLFGRCANVLRNWKLVNKETEAVKLETWAEMLETRSSNPFKIAWDPVMRQRSLQFSSSVPVETWGAQPSVAYNRTYLVVNEL
jgi:hypothetical protein